MKTKPSHEPLATSGPGGAHLGLFGRTRFLMSPEGDGGATAASAATAATTTTSGTPPTGQAPRLFSQEEVNQIVAERVARVKSAPAAAPAAPAPAAVDSNVSSSSGAGEDIGSRIGNMEFRSLFLEQLADNPIPRELREDAMQLARAQLGAKPTPDQMAQWFETKGKRLFGSSTPATAVTTTTTTPTNPAGNVPAATAPPPSAAATSAPAKVDFLTSGGMVDLTSLTPEQIDSLGPMGLKEIHERNKVVARRQSGQPALPRMGSARKD